MVLLRGVRRVRYVFFAVHVIDSRSSAMFLSSTCHVRIGNPFSIDHSLSITLQLPIMNWHRLMPVYGKYDFSHNPIHEYDLPVHNSVMPFLGQVHCSICFVCSQIGLYPFMNHVCKQCTTNLWIGQLQYLSCLFIDRFVSIHDPCLPIHKLYLYIKWLVPFCHKICYLRKKEER